MPRNRIVAAVAAAALVGGGAGAGAVALAHGSTKTAAAPARPAAPAANVSNAALTVGQVAKAATKSVVEIDATTASGTNSPFPYGGSGSSSAEGTGFVYDTKGDILTNAHVVDGSSSLTVKFWNGTKAKATLVGKDLSTDVAIVHVDTANLAPLTLANSDDVAVGDGVVAIGNPFGLDGTVTTGIVSALNREITSPDETPIEGAIQTDAAINHGNSGGPLLDMHGEVVGITSQIQSDGNGNEGVGFAIPANLVKSVASQLISSGSVQHALLGVTPAAATNGVRVAVVERGSAAASAGLKAGDVITAVDGRAVEQSEALRAIIAAHQPGDTLTITIRRNGAAKTVEATLGTRS